jgi:hypothetical protein
MSSASGRAATARAAISLFRRCLRSARRCPAFEKKEELLKYTKLRFDDSRKVRDPKLITHLLAEGEEELRTMNTFHAAREERDAAKGESSPPLTVDLRVAPSPLPPPSPLPTPSSTSTTGRSFFELLAVASVTLHNIDTSPIVVSSNREGSVSLQRLADASKYIDRASRILSLAKSDARDAIDSASREIEALDALAVSLAEISSCGTTTKVEGGLQGVKEFRNALEAARSCIA